MKKAVIIILVLAIGINGYLKADNRSDWDQFIVYCQNPECKFPTNLKDYCVNIIDYPCEHRGILTIIINCVACGKSSNQSVITPFKSHEFISYTNNLIPASCTEGSYYVNECYYCYKHFPDYQSEPLGHDWGEPFGSETSPATCTEHSSLQHTCSRCGITEYLPALGHDWGEWYTSSSPTCTEKGTKSRVCSRCGEIETGYDNNLPALGHQYTNHRCTVCKEWEPYSLYYIDASGEVLPIYNNEYDVLNSVGTIIKPYFDPPVRTLYVSGEITLHEALILKEPTNLVLADDAKLSISCRNSTLIEANGQLNIFGGPKGNGVLELFNPMGANAITINPTSDSDKLRIYGGRVSATSSSTTLNSPKGVELSWTAPGNALYCSNFTDVDLTIADGKKFVTADGKMFTAENYSSYAGKAVYPLFPLLDNARNDDVLTRLDGMSAYVQLEGRTLYKDGYWNTLCLPFSMDVEAFNSSVLRSAEMRALDVANSSLEDGLLTLSFTEKLYQIEAGKPYIIRWGKPVRYDENPAEYDLKDPIFCNVAISKAAPEKVRFEGGSFQGNYEPFSIVAAGASGENEGLLSETIFLGANSTIGYAESERTLHCFRAHFNIPASGSASQPVKAYQINFGDSQTTGILSIHNSEFIIHNSLTDEEAWYSLDGRRLSDRPRQKGVYIHGGKKVLVK